MIATSESHRTQPLADAYGEDERHDLANWEVEFGERVDALFWEFFEKSEDPDGWNRRWVINRDIDWRAVEAQKLDENLASLLESFYAVESFLPDFAGKGLGYYRRLLGLANNHINWSYEELKHGRALELVLLRSGARTQQGMVEFRRSVWREVWMAPFNTARRMISYASMQEKATHRNYEQLRSVARAQGAEGAAGAIRLISKDEAFHHAFYRDVMKIYMEYDEVGTARDLLYVANHFQMPAQHLLPDAASRIRSLARNRIVSKRALRDESIVPTIKSIGFRDFDELVSVAGVPESEWA
ncbi:MAG: acyl-ACP desaturase [Chloroflexota bacterium]